MPTGIYKRRRRRAARAKRVAATSTELVVADKSSLQSQVQEFERSYQNLNSLLGRHDSDSDNGTVEKSQGEIAVEETALNDGAVRSIQNAACLVQFAVLLNAYGPEQMRIMLSHFSKIGGLPK